MNQGKVKILIPNATGPTNVGDVATLDILIEKVKKSFDDFDLIIHSQEKNAYSDNSGYKVASSLYSWAVFENTNPVVRIFRITALLLSCFLIKHGIKVKINLELINLLSDYKSSDLIIFAPGGYLRSKKGIKQSLNLLMQVLMIKIASSLNNKVIVAPISVGPFGYKWQEKLVIKILGKLNKVYTREKYSFDILAQAGLKNIEAKTDLALFIDNLNLEKISNSFILGFTVRNWFNQDQQEKFENNLADNIAQFYKKISCQIQPIIQVDAEKYGEADSRATIRVIKNLEDRGVAVLEKITINDLNQAKQIYSKIDLLLGMRMHSNIIAATQGKPFVAIAYEHKTQGISSDLGVEDYCLTAENVTSSNVYNLLLKLHSDITQVVYLINSNILKLRKDSDFSII